MNADSDDEFFVGYLPRAPRLTGRFVRRVVIGCLAGAIACSIAVVVAHPRADRGVFEWGELRTLDGIVRAHPVPRLTLAAPHGDAQHALEVLLVAPFKHGAATLVEPFDGHSVDATGTLVYRDGAAMLELAADGLVDRGVAASAEIPTSLGPMVLRGEIVDSKCYLGVMKPGRTKPHRDCAVRCISGGVPPVLMVRDASGLPTYYVLVGQSGESLNRAILDFVAEPVEVRGTVERSGNLLFLKAAVGTIRRLGPEEEMR